MEHICCTLFFIRQILVTIVENCDELAPELIVDDRVFVGSLYP